MIELLLYITISSTVIFVIAMFLGLLIQSRAKNQTIAEVEQQGIQAMQMITQTIRNAEGINSPTAGGTSSSSSINVVNSGDDPTLFAITSNAITIKEGAGAVIPLTNDRVIASNITFQNLTGAGVDQTIKISFTLTYVNPENRNEFDFSKTFYGTATVREQ